jgi:hypothetical protein
MTNQTFAKSRKNGDPNFIFEIDNNLIEMMD